MKKIDNIRFELFSYDNKIPREKCFGMLDILVKFYNDFNVLVRNIVIFRWLRKIEKYGIILSEKNYYEV